MAKKDKLKNAESMEETIDTSNVRADSSEGQFDPYANSKLTQGQIDIKKKYEYVIRRKSVQKKVRRKSMAIVMMVFVLIASLICGLVYGVLAFIDFNSFRISVEKTHASYLTLSEDYEFTNPSAILSVSGPKAMDNWTYSWINITELLNSDGSLSDDNYIACSFYLSNPSDDPVFYIENINLTNVYKGLENTMRILLIKQTETEDESGNKIWSEPEYRCFAKVSADGVTPEYVAGGDEIIPDYVSDPNIKTKNEPWITQPFYSANNGVVLDAQYYPLLPKQKIRYAMAVWIEGTDKECTNDVLGGKVTYTFQFSVFTDENNKIITPDDIV